MFINPTSIISRRLRCLMLCPVASALLLASGCGTDDRSPGVSDGDEDRSSTRPDIGEDDPMSPMDEPGDDGAGGNGGSGENVGGAGGDQAGGGASSDVPASAPPGATVHDPLTREPNDSASTAAPIAVDELVAGVSFTSGEDTVDFYRLDVENGKTYTLELDAPCSVNYQIDAGADGAGGVLIARTYGTRPVEEFTPTFDGTAMLRLAYSGSCTGYSVVVRRSTVDGLQHDELTREPNDSAATANAIDVDELVSGVSFTSGEDTVDFYRLDVESGKTYTLEIDAPCSVNYQVDAGERGTGGVLIAQSYGTRPIEEFTPTFDGRVVLRLSYSGTCSGYSMVVRSSTEDGLEHNALTREPNDSPATGAPLAVDEVLTGVSFTASEDTIDFYRVNLAAEAIYTLEIDAPCSVNYRVDAGGDGAGGVLLAPSYGSRVSAEFSHPLGGVAALRLSYSGTCSGYSVVMRSATP